MLRIEEYKGITEYINAFYKVANKEHLDLARRCSRCPKAFNKEVSVSSPDLAPTAPVVSFDKPEAKLDPDYDRSAYRQKETYMEGSQRFHTPESRVGKHAHDRC
jgi:hypothetical protein